jgi:excisionase family DNA binding protein
MSAQSPIVVLSPDQLTELVRSAVRAELAAAAPSRAPQSEHVTVMEAAQLIGCSERHVGRLVRVGRLAATRLQLSGSSRVRVSRRSVEQLNDDARV